MDNITVNRYNGYIRGTNIIARCLDVILWILILMFVKLNSLRYATQLILQQSKVVQLDPLSPKPDLPGYWLLGRVGRPDCEYE